MTTASRLDQRHRDVAFALKNTAVVARQRKVRPVRLLVERLQPPVPRIVDKFRPDALGFADQNGVGIERCFVGAECGVKAAQHDRDAAPPELRSNLVCAPRRVGLDADGDEIGWFVEGYGLEPVVVEAHVDTGRS